MPRVINADARWRNSNLTGWWKRITVLNASIARFESLEVRTVRQEAALVSMRRELIICKGHIRATR